MRKSFVFILMSGIVSLGATSSLLGQSVQMAPSAALSQLQSILGDRADLPAAPAIRARAVPMADAGPKLTPLPLRHQDPRA